MKVMATAFMHEVGRSLPGWAEKFVNEEERSISLVLNCTKKRDEKLRRNYMSQMSRFVTGDC